MVNPDYAYLQVKRSKWIYAGLSKPYIYLPTYHLTPNRFNFGARMVFIESLGIKDVTYTLAIVCLAVYLLKQVTKRQSGVRTEKLPSKQSPTAEFSIKPVSDDFDWETEKPLKSYPFKDSEYKLTMGIKRIDAQDWLLIENTYLDRINEKTKIVTNSHPDYPADKDLRKSTIFSSPEGIPAIREFYDIVVQYMCEKYPKYFLKKGDEIWNKITGESIPASSAGVDDPELLLNALTRTIEEDFIILLPDPSKHSEPYGTEYYFKAGVFAFAAGFDPLEKFNQPLTCIHGPIPGYESKLKTSMNRFFDRLKPGEFVNRSNFSIQTHKKLYVDDANKGYHLTQEELDRAIPYEDLDFENQVHYRSERQVLIKMPKTGANVFTIRTYLHPLSQLKEDPETAARLSGSLQKFPDDMARYKNIVQPRPAVLRYLSEITTPS